MPVFKFQKADTIENTVEELIARIQWLTGKLDSKNVKRLDTNETVIKSADGTTEIVGPVLVQKDNVGTTRLQQGYDSGSGDFIFNMYNSAGNPTVSLDSNGNLVVESGTFKADIEIGTGNNVVKADGTNGLWVGNATYASAPFRVALDGSLVATSATITDGVITGGTIRTAASGERIEISGNQIKIYNGSEQLNGFATNNGTGNNYGDAYFYDSGVKVFEIYNNLTGTGFTIRPVGTAALGLGAAGKTTQPFGNWNFLNATVTNLNDGTYDYMTQNTSDNRYLKQTDGWTGTFTNGDGATVTVSNGQIISVV